MNAFNDAVTSSPVFQLHVAASLLDDVADHYLSTHFDINFNDFLILMTVDINEAPTQSKIAAEINLSRAAVTQRLGPLRQAGLIEVTRDPTHGRRHRVTVTDKGRDLWQRAWQGLDRYESGIAEGIDVQALSELLDVLVTNGRELVQKLGVR